MSQHTPKKKKKYDHISAAMEELKGFNDSDSELESLNLDDLSDMELKEIVNALQLEASEQSPLECEEAQNLALVEKELDKIGVNMLQAPATTTSEQSK